MLLLPSAILALELVTFSSFVTKYPHVPFYLIYWVLAIFKSITHCVTHMQTHYASKFITDILEQIVGIFLVCHLSFPALVIWCPVLCRQCCTTTARCWRTTTLRLPGASTCPGQSSTSWSTWTTWSSSVFASSSSRPSWLQTSRSTLISWLSSMPRSEMRKSFRLLSYMIRIDNNLFIDPLISGKLVVET